jgi:hypothetical protein
MRRAQVSVEFIIIFGFSLFVFMMFAVFLNGWLAKTRDVEDTAEKLAKEIKLAAITASLSSSDFSSTVAFPEKINGVDIKLEVTASDSLLMIKEQNDDGSTGRLLARAFLPIIDSFEEETANKNEGVMIIAKEGEKLKLVLKQAVN